MTLSSFTNETDDFQITSVCFMNLRSLHFSRDRGSACGASEMTRADDMVTGHVELELVYFLNMSGIRVFGTLHSFQAWRMALEISLQSLRWKAGNVERTRSDQINCRLQLAFRRQERHCDDQETSSAKGAFAFIRTTRPSERPRRRPPSVENVFRTKDTDP